MKTKQTVIVTLTLNEDEARWLKGIMQNPLFVEDGNPEKENPVDRKYRQIFWDALNQK